MMRTWLLIFFLILPGVLYGQTRGMRVVVHTPTGQEVPLYNNSYALVVGVSDYTNGWPDLPNAVKDAQTMADALRKTGFIVKTLFNPTSRQLNEAIDDLEYTMGGADDRLVFYFAGHGETETLQNKKELGYIVPVDAPLMVQDRRGFQEKAISMQKFELNAKRVPVKHALYIFDSCFSGSIFSLSRAAPKVIQENTARKTRQFITAGDKEETVPDESIFAQQLIHGLLEGKADLSEDGYVTGTELGAYLRDSVVNYSNGAQHPQYGKIRDPELDQGDFVFVLPRTETIEQGKGKAAEQALEVERLRQQIEIEKARREAEQMAKEAEQLRQELERLKKQPAESQQNEGDNTKQKDQEVEQLRSEQEKKVGIEIMSAKVYLQQTPPLYDKALDILNQAVAKHPESMEVQYLLGLISSRKQNYERALQQWEAVDPEKLGRKDRKVYEDERKQLWTNSFNSGVKSFGEKNYDEAAARFRIAAKANPTDPRAYVNLGLTLLNAQRIEESIEPLKKGLAVDPKNVTAWDGLSNAYIRLANATNDSNPKKKVYYKSAIDAYTNFLQFKKDDAVAYFNLAWAYLATGDTTKAMATYQAGIDNVPQTVDFYFNLSLLYSRTKQYDKVTALLQKAKELRPDDPEILLNLGTTYYNIKQFTSAIDPLEMHLKLKPNSIDGWDTLGRVYLGMANEYKTTDAAKAKEYTDKGLAHLKKSEDLVKSGEGR